MSSGSVSNSGEKNKFGFRLNLTYFCNQIYKITILTF